MKKVSKFGLLLAVAVMACAAFAVGAQADHGTVDINPDATPIEGTAAAPTLDYEGVIVQCDTGTAVGTTGTNSDVVNVEVDFFDNCNINGLGATVSCSASSSGGTVGTARLHALTDTTNLGEVDRLNTGFSCVVTVPGVCTVSVGAQELPSDVDGNPGRNQANLINEGSSNPSIDALVDVEASRTGSSLCGPATGDGAFTALYELDTPVTFD